MDAFEANLGANPCTHRPFRILKPAAPIGLFLRHCDRRSRILLHVSNKQAVCGHIEEQAARGVHLWTVAYGKHIAKWPAWLLA